MQKKAVIFGLEPWKSLENLEKAYKNCFEIALKISQTTARGHGVLKTCIIYINQQKPFNFGLKYDLENFNFGIPNLQKRIFKLKFLLGYLVTSSEWEKSSPS